MNEADTREGKPSTNVACVLYHIGVIMDQCNPSDEIYTQLNFILDDIEEALDNYSVKGA